MCHILLSVKFSKANLWASENNAVLTTMYNSIIHIPDKIFTHTFFWIRNINNDNRLNKHYKSLFSSKSYTQYKKPIHVNNGTLNVYFIGNKRSKFTLNEVWQARNVWWSVLQLMWSCCLLWAWFCILLLLRTIDLQVMEVSVCLPCLFLNHGSRCLSLLFVSKSCRIKYLIVWVEFSLIFCKWNGHGKRQKISTTRSCNRPPPAQEIYAHLVQGAFSHIMPKKH